jgi:hypothetical protein
LLYVSTFPISIWSIDATLDFESDEVESTGKEVDLIVNIQGLLPVYLTVQSAFPAYIGLMKRRDSEISTTSVIGETSRRAAARGSIFLPNEPAVARGVHGPGDRTV